MTADAQTIHPASNAFRRAGAVLTRLSTAYGGALVPVAITAVAAFIRFWRLGHPHSIVPLDETYYAPNAFGYVCHGTDMSFKANAPHNCDGLEPVFVVHPPVGKLLIAAGIKIFGYRPFGWRFAPALVGSLSVLVIYLIGRRLWEKRWAATAAAILLGVEGLQFVQSRLAMLDIFVSFFILLGVLLMLQDRARAPTSTGVRWWRLGAGVAFGLAVGSKWSAVFVLPVVAAVMLAWEVVRIPRERRGHVWWRTAAGVLLGLYLYSIAGPLPLLAVVFAALAWDLNVLPRERRERMRWRIAVGAIAGVALAERMSLFVFGGFTLAGILWENAVRRAEARHRATAPPPVPPPAIEEDLAPPTEGDKSSTTTSESDVAPLRDKLGFQILAIGATCAVLPFLVYVGSYTPWFLSTKRYVPPRCNTAVVENGVTTSVPKAGLDLWFCDQKEIAEYHQNLKSTDQDGNPIHPYMSKAWSWPWISRPASHYYQRYCAPGGGAQPCAAGQELRDEEVLGLPNPLIWWTAFFVALPACLYWIVKRDETAGLLVILLAPLVLPWFVTTRPLFMFYMAPASPFLVLMVVHALQRWRLRWAAVWFVALSIALFGYFYPVLAAYPIPSTGPTGWQSRIWFGHGQLFNRTIGDCTSKGVKILCWI